MQDLAFNSSLVGSQIDLIAKVGWHIHQTQTEIKWRAGVEHADIFSYSIQPSGRIHRTFGGSLKTEVSAHARLMFLRDNQAVEKAASVVRSEFQKIPIFNHAKCSLQILVSEEKTPTTKMRIRIDDIWFAEEYLSPDQLQARIETHPYVIFAAEVLLNRDDDRRAVR